MLSSVEDEHKTTFGNWGTLKWMTHEYKVLSSVDSRLQAYILKTKFWNWGKLKWMTH